MDRIYTTHDIARLIQVDPSTVSKWIDKGVLLAFRTPGGHRRVRAGDLRTFLASHQMPIPDELGGGKVRLIAVDDDERALRSLELALRPYASSVELETTTSGIEALLRVSENPPHGLLVDIGLPDLDGVELCRRVYQRRNLQRVKILAFTARWTPAAEREVMAAGAAACLPKPLDVSKVLEHFRVAVGLAARA